MRVLVAGASGFLGQAAVHAFVAAGHEVVGLARSPQSAEWVRAAGGIPAQGDILSVGAVVEAARGCEAIVHLAASNQGAAGELGQSMKAKVRVDGCYSLVAAARAVGARRILVGSGTWLMGDHKEPITEATPARPVGSSMFNWQAERAAMDARKPGSLEVVVVRPAMVYGDGSWFKEMVDEIADGSYRVMGGGQNHWSPVEAGDTGEAFRLALERGKDGEVYLVADDHPITVRALADLVAEGLGAKRPESMPLAESAKVHGESLTKLMTANQLVSNAKMKALGWSPKWRDCREGIPPVLHAMGRAASG